VHDQPEPTEEVQEQGPERRQEEDDMRGPGHENPDRPQEEADDA
jgi:hypothetical protein